MSLNLVKISSPGKRVIQKEARRREIIEAAFREFSSRGFTATRLDDVAERAGIGKGTIYLYFESKESLFEEMIRQNLFPARDAQAEFVTEFKGSAAELLTIHLKNLYLLYQNEKIALLLAMMLGESNRFPVLNDFILKEIIGKSQQVFSNIIQKGVESGEFRETNIATYSQIIIAQLYYVLLDKCNLEKSIQ